MKRFFSLVGRATSSSSPSSPTSPPTTSPSETFTPPPPPPINTTIRGNANTVKEAIEKFERSATNNTDGAEGERTVKVSDGVRKGALVKAGTGGQKDVRQVAFKEDEDPSFPIASTSSANQAHSPTSSPVPMHTNGSVSSHLPPHLQQLPFRPSSSQSTPYAYSNTGHFSPDLLFASGSSSRDPTTIYAPVTWTEMINESGRDLTENISGRERTRQEVLWEITTTLNRYYIPFEQILLLLPQVLSTMCDLAEI
ncbi:hypothetical protein BT69DRAFT_28211 [Atractiella rhizophila]|nr:hypothetical protein BT69DRAFT_28211 [Atractiella rhizophila]